MKLNIPENKQEVFIKSIMWNSVIDTFKDEKNIDIKGYLISIQLKSKTILIKTNKPLVNTEALLLDDKIKKVFDSKIQKLGIKFEKYDIKYI